MGGPSDRMLAILSLLQVHREWPGGELAQRLGVTPRTVRRDIDRLRELGYTIDAARGPDGGYRLEAGSELPPLLFDDEQAVAIAVALQSAAASGVDISEALERALATVRQVMPSRLRHRVDALRYAAAPSGEGVDPTVLETVSTAVRERRTLRFTYGIADDPPRHVEPHGLVSRHARWYLVAWDLAREDWRIFRLDRLVPRTPGGRRFARRDIPTGDAVTFVAARARGSSDSTDWPCVGRLRMALPVDKVAPWIGDGDARADGDDASLVTLGSWSWTGLVALALRFDAPFTILGPPEFVAAASVLEERLSTARGAAG
jgi:predicted DNA-binding transcriptional regulator YafY